MTQGAYVSQAPIIVRGFAGVGGSDMIHMNLKNHIIS